MGWRRFRSVARAGLLAGLVALPMTLTVWNPFRSSAADRPALPPLPAASSTSSPHGMIPESPSGLQGAGSCAASACHGAAGGEGRPTLDFRKGSEYSVWVERDPHASAFQTLYSTRSQQIARKLGLSAAHEAKVCLACHATLTDDEVSSWPDQIPSQENSRTALLRDGVGCESCHGPSAGWLDPHKQPGWRDRHATAQLGFVDAQQVESRGAACVKCHVGSPGRDVDHDLIAAGHPRLYFEFAAYQAKLPRHWSALEDRRRNEPLEARLWLHGQLASATAALTQLEYRAGSKPAGTWVANGKTAPWPELAELSCFACHHDLASPSWRQERSLAGRSGLAPWGTWHFAVLEQLLAEVSPGQASSIEEELNGLRRHLEAELPDRVKVVEESAALGQRLVGLGGAFANGGTINTELLRNVALRLSDPSRMPVREWDEATQVYLGLAALTLSLGERGQPSPERKIEVKRDLNGMLRLLRFPDPGVSESPSDFGSGVAGKSLPQFDRLREELRTHLKSR